MGRKHNGRRDMYNVNLDGGRLSRWLLGREVVIQYEQQNLDC
jgi:hypothetical protein